MKTSRPASESAAAIPFSLTDERRKLCARADVPGRFAFVPHARREQRQHAQVFKAIRMYTAQPLAGFNTLEQGAGLLNVEGAIRLARLIKASPQLLTNGSSPLTGALPKSEMSLIAGESCWWGQGVITNFCFLYGSRLMMYWQGMYSPGVLLADATCINSSGLKQTPGLVSSGVPGSQGAVLNNGIVMADGSCRTEW